MEKFRHAVQRCDKLPLMVSLVTVGRPKYLRLAQRVATARMAVGMSQPELAQELGVSKGMIGSIETGTKRLDVRKTRRLADILRLPADELLWLSDYIDEPTGEVTFTAPAEEAAIFERWLRRGWLAPFLSRLEEVGMSGWLKEPNDAQSSERADQPEEDVRESDPADREPCPR